MVKNMNSLQTLVQCGTGIDQTMQKEYEFLSGNSTIIGVGLTGETTLFNENLPIFEQSIQSVVINNPGDIQQGILGLAKTPSPDSMPE
jgi:hypothetical protein